MPWHQEGPGGLEFSGEPQQGLFYAGGPPIAHFWTHSNAEVEEESACPTQAAAANPALMTDYCPMQPGQQTLMFPTVPYYIVNPVFVPVNHQSVCTLLSSPMPTPSPLFPATPGSTESGDTSGFVFQFPSVHQQMPQSPPPLKYDENSNHWISESSQVAPPQHCSR